MMTYSPAPRDAVPTSPPALLSALAETACNRQSWLEERERRAATLASREQEHTARTAQLMAVWGLVPPALAPELERARASLVEADSRLIELAARLAQLRAGAVRLAASEAAAVERERAACEDLEREIAERREHLRQLVAPVIAYEALPAHRGRVAFAGAHGGRRRGSACRARQAGGSSACTGPPPPGQRRVGRKPFAGASCEGLRSFSLAMVPPG